MRSTASVAKNIIPFNKCILETLLTTWVASGVQAFFGGWQLPPLATPVVSPLCDTEGVLKALGFTQGLDRQQLFPFLVFPLFFLFI